MPYHIDKILAIAEKYGIPVVEDAAEGMIFIYIYIQFNLPGL